MNLMVNFCLVNRGIKRLYIVFPVLSLISYSIINSTKVSAIYFCHANISFDFNKQRFLDKLRDHDLWKQNNQSVAVAMEPQSNNLCFKTLYMRDNI